MEDEFKPGDKVEFAQSRLHENEIIYFKGQLHDPKSDRKYSNGVFVRYHYDRRYALIDCARARATKDGTIMIDQFPVPVAKLRRPGWNMPSVPTGSK